MRIHFLVLAHEHPRAAWRLAERLLDAPDAAVTVHWDSATALPTPPAGLAIALVASPAPGGWGDAAHFDAVRAALVSRAAEPFDWLVVLSGACYPIRPLAQLAEMLETTEHRSFLDTSHPVVVPPSEHGGLPIDYLQRRYFFCYAWFPRRVWARLPPGAQHVLEAGLQRTVRAALPEDRVWVQRRPRGFSPGLGRRARSHPFTDARPCRTGSDWFALARPAYDDLVAQLVTQHDVVQHLRSTFFPNEAVFHTLLLPRWEAVNAGHNLHFRRMVGNRAHPETLRAADIPEMVATERFFARKFDPDDTTLLDRLDRELLGA